VRHKIVTILAVSAIGATTLAVAGPSMASTTAPAAATSAATVVSDHVDKLKKALAGLVADKTLTQAQANKVAETLKSTDLGPGGPGGHRAHGGGPGLAAAATALKVTETELRTALEGGKTLAAVAKEKNVPVATVVAALVKDEQARIAQEVKDGKLTQAKADERLKDLTARVTERVNHTRPAGPDHERGAATGSAPTKTSTPTPST